MVDNNEPLMTLRMTEEREREREKERERDRQTDRQREMEVNYIHTSCSDNNDILNVKCCIPTCITLVHEYILYMYLPE